MFVNDLLVEMIAEKIGENLINFSLQSCNISEKSLQFLFAFFPNLQNLNLKNCRGISVWNLENFYQKTGINSNFPEFFGDAEEKRTKIVVPEFLQLNLLDSNF